MEHANALPAGDPAVFGRPAHRCLAET